MTSPQTSAATSTLAASGNPNVDALVDTGEKWGGTLGTGASLSFSFPWLNGSQAYWQTGYSDEISSSTRFGLNTTQQAAARSALQNWANLANLVFTEVTESASNVGDIRFAFSGTVTSSSWGWSYSPSDYWANAADVWINPTHGSETDWAAGSYNFQALMHEIGHGLGLKHPGNYGDGVPPYLSTGMDTTQYSIMSYNQYANNVFRRVTANGDGTYNFDISRIYPDTPMLLDIQTIQYIYGANWNYHSGNDVYSFDPASPFYRTLWDGGGNDTISVSGFSQACTIDLRAGHYSTIAFQSDALPPGYTGGTQPTYTGENDLAIAYNCDIENVVGGTGNDSLTGNDLNNQLTGGRGNDSLEGGAGRDTALFSGQLSAYTLAPGNSGGFTLTNTQGQEGTDSLQNIERLDFSDASIALDLGITQAGGETALLLGAVLGRNLAFANDPIKRTVVGNVLALFDDSSYTMQILAGALMRLNHDSLDIWTALAGGHDNTSIARYVLTVVQGHGPDQSALNAAVTALNAETTQATQGTWLAAQALSDANQLQVGLTGLAQTGLIYQ